MAARRRAVAVWLASPDRDVALASRPGFNFSAKFRRNFGFFSFPLVTGIRNFGIFRYISFQNSKFNKIHPKFAEIHQNSGTEFRFRRSPGFHRKTKW